MRRCALCRKEATRKVVEDIHDSVTFGYVCEAHFKLVMGESADDVLNVNYSVMTDMLDQVNSPDKIHKYVKRHMANSISERIEKGLKITHRELPGEQKWRTVFEAAVLIIHREPRRGGKY